MEGISAIGDWRLAVGDWLFYNGPGWISCHLHVAFFSGVWGGRGRDDDLLYSTRGITMPATTIRIECRISNIEYTRENSADRRAEYQHDPWFWLCDQWPGLGTAHGRGKVVSKRGDPSGDETS